MDDKKASYAGAELSKADMSARRRNAIGLDVGTYTLQAARRNQDGSIDMREEINGFLHIPYSNDTQIMLGMIDAAKAPYIKHQNDIYVLGGQALKICYAWGKEFRRPMKDGILSVSEKDAFNVLGVMIRSIVSPLPGDQTVVAYSSPAKPLNGKGDTSYHQKVLDLILQKGEFNDGWRIKAVPVNEARAIVRDQLEDQGVTGIGISFGAGMVNASFCMFGVPIFEFSLVGCGDWIDQEAARATGETAAFINKQKETIDLTKETMNHIERAIALHYQILLETVSSGMAEGIKESGKRTPPGEPCRVVVGGGTASPPGFIQLLEKQMRKQNFGDFELGEMTLAPDHKRSVARGLLAFAETLNV